MPQGFDSGYSSGFGVPAVVLPSNSYTFRVVPVVLGRMRLSVTGVTKGILRAVVGSS